MKQMKQDAHRLPHLRGVFATLSGTARFNSFFTVIFALATLLLTCQLGAQSTNGVVTGSVSDPEGNVVQGATVTLIDTARGVSFKATTNDSGTYRFSLPIGNYKAVVEKTGFETLKKAAFDMELGQTDRIDFTLKVGSTSEVVEVSGDEAPLLKEETAQVDTVIDEKTTVDLPLATRNYVQMTLLVPGSTNPDPTSMTTAQNQQNAGRPMINGNNEQSNNFLLDGLENNQLSDNMVGYVPSIDAIQEFTIITNNPSAEYGNFEGGTVTTAIKSGTNKLHGSAYEFWRNNDLNASPWEAGFLDAATPGAVKTTVLRWNMFGGTIGGPVLKNKLFFFADVQDQRLDFPGTGQVGTVFTKQERLGDFSDQPTQLYDPTTAVGDCPNVVVGGKSVPARCPLAGNNLANVKNPSAAFPGVDAAAKTILASPLYPTPNLNSTQPYANNYTYLQNSALNGLQGDIKVDYAASDKDHIFARSSKYYSTNPVNNSAPFVANDYTESWGDSGIGGWTRQITQNLFNDVRFGVNYTKIAYGTTNNATGDLGTTAGIANANSNAGHPVAGLPALNPQNDNGLTMLGSAGADALFADTSIQLDEAVTWIHKTHTVKGGFQYRRYRINTFYAGNDGENGEIFYGGNWTGVNSSIGGNGGADFVFGAPTQTQRGAAVGVWGQRASLLAGYVQDDWKVTNNLTLNIGIRYDNHTPWYEVNGKDINFDLKTGQPVYLGTQQETLLNTLYSPYNPETSNLKGGYNSYNGGWDFQPRLGFAWTPEFLHGKTVVRGAYGVTSYMEGSGTNLRLTENTPFVPDNSAVYTQNANATPTQTTEDGFLAGVTPNLQATKLRAWDPNVKPAVDNMWNLAIQEQLTRHDTVQLAYVGQKVTHTLVPQNYAQFNYDSNGNLIPGPDMGEATNNNTTIPSLFQVPGTNPNNKGAWVAGTGSVGNQTYNALQATYGHRFDTNLEVQLAYTWGRCMADNIGYYGSGHGQSQPAAWYWQNQWDQKAEWGPCYYDAAQILTGYGVYSLPFGHKQKFGAGVKNVTNAIIGNWQISLLTTDHTGYALTAVGTVNVPAAGATGELNGVSRADCNGTIHYDRTFVPGLGERFFDATNLTLAKNPTGFGTCSNGSIRGPGLNALDASLIKAFPIIAAFQTEFRLDAVNVLNHPIFQTPDMNIADEATTFGVANGTNAAEGERQLQLSFKITF